jgi:hypothetical protein
MEQSKWRDFMNDPRYHLDDLGRPAFFLIPTKKLEWVAGGETIQRQLHRFLITNFGGFTTALIPSFGIWKDANQEAVEDECRQYRVSFDGKERIPLLAAELARIAALIDEDCIYLEAGQYAATVSPRR